MASQSCTLVFKTRHWCSDCFMNMTTLFAVILLGLNWVLNDGLRSTHLTLNHWPSPTWHQIPQSHTQAYRDELLQSQQSLARQCRLLVVEFLQQKHKLFFGKDFAAFGGPGGFVSLVKESLPAEKVPFSWRYTRIMAYKKDTADLANGYMIFNKAGTPLPLAKQKLVCLSDIESEMGNNLTL